MQCIEVRTLTARKRMQFLQTTWPLGHKHAGKTCRVHRGFLASWAPDGVAARVTELISALLDSAADRGAVQLYTTGHSLGGAIASLAAHDIARACELTPQQVTCYTFGCPRVGNHAFAALYRTIVPDTWHCVRSHLFLVLQCACMGQFQGHGQELQGASRLT